MTDWPATWEKILGMTGKWVIKHNEPVFFIISIVMMLGGFYLVGWRNSGLWLIGGGLIVFLMLLFDNTNKRIRKTKHICQNCIYTFRERDDLGG